MAAPVCVDKKWISCCEGLMAREWNKTLQYWVAVCVVHAYVRVCACGIIGFLCFHNLLRRNVEPTQFLLDNLILTHYIKNRIFWIGKSKIILSESKIWWLLMFAWGVIFSILRGGTTQTCDSKFILIDSWGAPDDLDCQIKYYKKSYDDRSSRL